MTDENPPTTSNPAFRLPLHFATATAEADEQKAVAEIVAAALTDAVQAFGPALADTGLLPDELMEWLHGDLTGLSKGARRTARALLRMAELVPDPEVAAEVLRIRENDYAEALAEEAGI